ncbi:MAG TPA: 16S rRNA (guanine(527)-N(7))-methyltransferase RsmG [Alphaproteobacteria bacterium]
MAPDNKSLKYMTETLNVSRETLPKLEKFVQLAIEWNKAINLISPGSIPDIWWRHIVDSAQLYPLLPAETKHLVDLGSGGGFPAIILAILGVPKVTMIESDQRKSIFLREVSRQLDLRNTVIVNHRIETAEPQKADIVTARALASLDKLIAWAKPHGNHFIFPKGEHVRTEMMSLGDVSHMEITEHSSVTDDLATIIEIKLK